MDIQLKELIDKIKKEGVDEADEKGKQIISDAEKQASDIINKAKKESDELISRAKTEIEQLEGSGKEALKQAGRDLILNIKSALTGLFDTVIKNEVDNALSQDVISEIIPMIIKEFVKKDSDQIEVLLSQEDCKKLEKSLIGNLSAELKKGVVIKPHSGIKSGFRIAEKSGDSYYDFTDEGIAENLIQYINPLLSEILMDSVAGEK